MAVEEVPRGDARDELAAVPRARLLQLPDPERRAALAALRPETALALLHDWRFRARDAQLAPRVPGAPGW